MPKVKISEFSSTPANNTDIDSINLAEGCAPSGINDAIRELMAQLKDWQSGTSNDPMVIGSTGSLTLNQGTANGVAYLNGSKVVTSGSALTFDGTNVLTLFRTTGTEANEPTIKFSNLVFAGQNAGVIKSSNGGLALDIQSPSDSTYQLRSRIYMSGGSGDSISFQASSNNGSTYGERMVLTSTGLGIGTSSPAFKLDVNGDAGITASESYLYFYSNYSVGNNSRVRMRAVGAGGGSGYGGDFRVDTKAPNNTWNTDAMTLDASGNFILGATSASGRARIVAAASADCGLVLDTSTNNYASFISLNALNDNGAIYNYIRSQVSGGTEHWKIGGGATASTMAFSTGGTERARIDSSGNFLVGTTSAISSGKYSSSFDGSVSNGIILKTTLASTGTTYIGFVNSSSSIIGSVTQNGASTVAYNTSSDYRLKNTIAPMTGALAKVAQLKPCTYKWNSDGSNGQGFIAHELAEVVPECVSGEKDAVHEDGTPKYQGIDTSFLVATLTAAIQELKAEFDAYKASHP